MMNIEEQIREKIRAEQMGGQCGSNTFGNVMSQDMQPAEPSLRERVVQQRHRADKESRRAEALRELEYLLDKHPEVSRILDLFELVKP